MKENLCKNVGCKERVLNQWVGGIVAYCSCALVLASPILNAFGADVQDIANLAPYHISLSGVLFCLLLFVSGLAGTYERHTNIVMCILTSVGIPGIVVAVLTALGTKVF